MLKPLVPPSEPYRQGVTLCASNPTLGRQTLEDQKFKVTLGYVVSLRLEVRRPMMVNPPSSFPTCEVPAQ